MNINLRDWNDNKETIEDMIKEYCVEERIIFNQAHQQMLDNLFYSYSSKVKSINDLKDMNKSILKTYIETIKHSNIQEQHSSNNNIPVNVYTRDDILKERSEEIKNKFDSVKNDFETFNLKKPSDIDFSDKVKEDDVSIDKKIEEELKNRQYDMLHNDNDRVKDNSKKVSFDENSNTYSNAKTPENTRENTRENTHENTRENTDDNKLNLILNKISDIEISINKLFMLLSDKRETNETDETDETDGND